MPRILVDTNAIISSVLGKDPGIQKLLIDLETEGHQLCIAAQTIYEFWSVATRPRESNGFDQDSSKAHREVLQLRAAYYLLSDPTDLLDRWLVLCHTHDVKGRSSHDARIAALMDSYGIVSVVSLDRRGFSRFPHLTVLTP